MQKGTGALDTCVRMCLHCCLGCSQAEAQALHHYHEHLRGRKSCMGMSVPLELVKSIKGWVARYSLTTCHAFSCPPMQQTKRGVTGP